VGNKFGKILIIGICIGVFAAVGVAFAQKDVSYDGGSAGAVVFRSQSMFQARSSNATLPHQPVRQEKRGQDHQGEHSGDSSARLPQRQEGFMHDGRGRLRPMPQEK